MVPKWSVGWGSQISQSLCTNALIPTAIFISMYDVCNEMCLKQGSKFGKSFPLPTSHTRVFCKLTLLRSRNRLNDHYLWPDHHFQIICILPWGFCATLASNGSQTGLYRISPSKKSNSKNAVLMNLVAGHFRLDPFLALPVLFFFFLFSPFSGLSSPAFVWHGQFCETQGTCWHAFLQGL